VKNFNITAFGTGIMVESSNNAHILNNNIFNNAGSGIQISGSLNGTITGNTTDGNGHYGIIVDSNYNNFQNNIISLNGLYGLVIYGQSDYNIFRNNTLNNNRFNLNAYGSNGPNNDLDTSNLINSRPIYYVRNASNQIYDESTNAGVFYCINCSNVTVKNLTPEKNLFRVSFWNTNDSSIENSNLSNNDTMNSYGIILFYSNRNSITDNAVAVNEVGAAIMYSNDNIISRNEVNGNTTYGIYMTGSSGNTLTNNNISDNGTGIKLYNNFGGQIYNNNFIGNNVPAYYYSQGGDVFNLAMPIGGNYWSNFDTLQEGCADTNNDNFCDAPYVISGYNVGQDNLPWTAQDGWASQPPTFSNLNQYKSDGQSSISEGGVIIESTTVFRATLNDLDNDQIKLQVELKEFNQPFDGLDIIESGYVNSGNDASTTPYDLIPASYHWRARAVDNQGNIGSWQEFGVSGNIDFVVKTLEQAAADLAKELANHPKGYLWGGKGWDYGKSEFIPSADILAGYEYLNGQRGGGVDCSGLITWAFNRMFNPIRPAIENFVKYINADGLHRDYQSDPVAEINIQPGDSMFFDWDGDQYMDHVAIYVGESGGYDVVNAANEIDGIITRVKNSYKLTSGFVDFRRIHQADVTMEIVAGSPIDLIVTDPDGFVINSNSIIPSNEEFIREVPGILYYLEMERGKDGRPIDRVYAPALKTGSYIIQVAPEAGVSPAETFDLEFQTGSQTIILADDVLIEQAPLQGYGIIASSSGALATFMPVSIDVKPNSYPNSINLGSGGTVPTVIFGTATFDVVQINPATITLANAAIKLKGNGQSMANYTDINGDGFVDVVVHIITEALQLTAADVKAELNGYLVDGRNIKGFDSVRIVP
jgi:parallel beta-helix repeat protein